MRKIWCIYALFLTANLSAATIISQSGRYYGIIKGQTEAEVRLQQTEGGEIALKRDSILQIYDDENKLIWSHPSIVAEPLILKNPEATASADEKKKIFPVLELDFSGSFGYLNAGNEYTILKSGFNPPPASLHYSGFSVAAKYFPVRNFGLGFRYSWGTTHATMSTGDSLSAYSLQMPEPFVAVRYVTADKHFSLEANAGFIFSIVDFTSDFKQVLQSSAQSQGLTLVFPAAATGPGYSLRIAGQYYFYEHLYLRAAVEYLYISPRYAGATVSFDGAYLNFPISVGIFL